MIFAIKRVKCILILTSLFFLQANSQIEDVNFLFSNNYHLFKCTQGSGGGKDIYENLIRRKNDSFEIKKVSHFDSLKQKYIQKFGFDLSDTISIVEWDLLGNISQLFIRICKVRYLPKDTCIIFYNEKIINKDVSTNMKGYYPIRKFKVLKCTKNEIILLDLDITELNRKYFFKAVSRPKK
ncbi:MAG: hypothetical protein ACXVPQ_01915 [Bacteroidia bacterium]